MATCSTGGAPHVPLISHCRIWPREAASAKLLYLTQKQTLLLKALNALTRWKGFPYGCESLLSDTNQKGKSLILGHMLDLSSPNPTTCALNNLKVQRGVANALALLQEQQVQVTKSDLAQQSLAQCSLLTQYGKCPVSLKAWQETIILIIYPGQQFPPGDPKASFMFS